MRFDGIGVRPCHENRIYEVLLLCGLRMPSRVTTAAIFIPVTGRKQGESPDSAQIWPRKRPYFPTASEKSLMRDESKITGK